MAVVEANSIVTLFESNGMLSKSYNVDDLKNDLNTLFPSFDYANISEVIKYIATTTSAPIRNRHDLNVLTLDIKSAKQRSYAYKQFDETLSLSSVDEFKYDPDLVIPKIKYCKIFGYPYCDDNGVLFKEVVHEFESGSYLRRFFDIAKKKYNNGYFNGYEYVLENIEEDKVSEFYGLLQSNSIKYFGKLCFINKDFENRILPILEDDNFDINAKMFSAFSMLKKENPFIDLDLIKFSIHNDDYDRRNGQR